MSQSKKAKVILWTAPKCLSTVFHRSISTLKRAKCFQEVFSGAYYFGPQRSSDRYTQSGDIGLDLEGLTAGELTYDTITKLLVSDYPNVDLVFTKELAYTLPELDMIRCLEEFTHTFLIRDPERAIYSNYKTTINELIGSDYLVPSNGGFEEMYVLFNFIKKKTGATPIMLNASDLQTHPDETMKSYCEAVGIEFDSKMTSWEQGPSPSHFKIFAQWNSTIDQSTGFIKSKPEELPPVPLNKLPNEVLLAIEKSKVYYHEMNKCCIHITKI